MSSRYIDSLSTKYQQKGAPRMRVSYYPPQVQVEGRAWEQYGQKNKKDRNTIGRCHCRLMMVKVVMEVMMSRMMLLLPVLTSW